MRTLPNLSPVLPIAVAGVAAASVMAWYHLCHRVGSKSDNEHEDNPGPQSNGRLTLEECIAADNGRVTMAPIGVVRSIYRLCVGTPRQGLLAPHARGRIELYASSADMVDGLDAYSHVWIVFCFHLNTIGRKTPTKIAPPALGGLRKVGVLSTRSPHRPNPVGLTLAKLDSITTIQQRTNGGKPSPIVCLNISGLDLVDGTPVLDVKPFVPVYDAPTEGVVVPDWVAGGLATQRPVYIDDLAIKDLESILDQDPLALDFYGGNGESTAETLDTALACIQEVLAIDVRSEWQTTKARQGQSQATRAKRLSALSGNSIDDDTCSQQIDNLLVNYVVRQAATTNRETSEGSGAEDEVTITCIQLLSQASER